MGTTPPVGPLASISSDPAALEEFYRSHVEAVQRFVARRVSDPHLAADLTADVFVAAIESAHKYRPERGAPIAWLYGIAQNITASERRHDGRRVRAVSRVVGSSLVEQDDLAILEARLDAESQSRQLYEAMARLPEGEREVLELVALEGMTTREVAATLAIKPVTARVRLHRARRTMQQLVADPSKRPTSIAEARP